jgi:6-methylsalicylate decarboxylase
MTVVDVHQHLWPPELVEVLRRRKQPPRLEGSRLTVVGEGERDVDLTVHDLGRRLALLDSCGIDVAVMSLPPTLGIDELPLGEADELVDAYEHGILELVATADGRIRPLSVRPREAGFAGVCVGAAKLAALDELAPWLDELADRNAFLFVHPQPASRPPAAPDWWIPVVEYTAQLHAAYAAWLAHGAERWPSLKVVFASLAGGGPFHLERLRAWGIAQRDVLHENVFFETSSYGTRALELCLSTFGVGQLLFGSDTPVLDAAPGLDAVRSFGDAVADSLCVHNPDRLLS